jgi:hypothetical protein
LGGHDWGIFKWPSGPAIATLPLETTEPAWTSRVEWQAVTSEIGRGFELKRIWEERAAHATGYPNFWKYLNKRYAWLLKRTVTLREFDPGTHYKAVLIHDRKAAHQRAIVASLMSGQWR